MAHRHRVYDPEELLRWEGSGAAEILLAVFSDKGNGGRLCVGIGFGLQSVVNNFVSGLVLLFERPIDKGDSVEIGNLRGTVQHIGIRASVVRTFQGADIIVLNSQFIAEKVTNWTHGDRSMRIDLPGGGELRDFPKEGHRSSGGGRARTPRGFARSTAKSYLMGFANSSINFELGFR